MPTAIAARCVERDVAARRAGTAIAGASCSACRRPPASCTAPMHRAAVADRRPTPARSRVEREQQHVSRPRPSTSASSASLRAAHERRRAARPTRRGRRRRRPASSSTSSRSAGSDRARPGRPTRRPSPRRRRRARRSPRSCSSCRWSRRYTSTCTSGSRPVVLAHERERRAHHRLVDAERDARCPWRTPSCPRRGRRRARRRRRARSSAPSRCRERVRSPPRSRVVRASASSRRRRARRARASTVHEVGARLRERGTAVAQHRRRVERGDQHRAVAERELAARAAS